MANEIQATGTFMTKKGLLLLTKLAGAKGGLHLTRAAVGTGRLPDGYSPEYMMDLAAYRMDAQISDYGTAGDKAYITAQVNSSQVEQGFLITEVGIFAEDPDEGEVLYGYMDLSTDPTYMYANGSTNRLKFAEFTLYVLIGNVSRVTAAVTPSSIITRETFKADLLQAVDTHGLLGEPGAIRPGQALLDALASKAVDNLVTNDVFMEQMSKYILKEKIVDHFLATDPGTVLSGPMGKALKDEITQLNSDINVRYNPDTDYIQVYYDGQWTDTAYAGAQGTIIPYMTSNNAPYGVVSESSNASPYDPAWHVFDGSPSTFWMPGSGENISSSYVQYRFVYRTKIKRVEVTSGPITVSQNCVGKSAVFVLKGSQDGINWVDISGEYTIIGDNKQTITCYTTDFVNPYLYFRLQFKRGNSLFLTGSYGYGLMEVAVY